MPVDPKQVKPNFMYSVSETAKILAVTEQTVRLHLNNRKLRGKKAKNGRWTVRGKEILRFFDGDEGEVQFDGVSFSPKLPREE